MPRYMETAKKANDAALKLLELLPPDQRPQGAALMAQLVNLGVRCSPRACQSTVRFNAVRRAMQGLPVKLTMTEVPGYTPGRTFNALVITPVAELTAYAPIVEGADNDADE